MWSFLVYSTAVCLKEYIKENSQNSFDLQGKIVSDQIKTLNAGNQKNNKNCGLLWSQLSILGGFSS